MRARDYAQSLMEYHMLLTDLLDVETPGQHLRSEGLGSSLLNRAHGLD